MNKIKKVVILGFLLSNMMHSVMHADDSSDRIIGGVIIAATCALGYFGLSSYFNKGKEQKEDKATPKQNAFRDEQDTRTEQNRPRPSDFNEGYDVGQLEEDVEEVSSHHNTRKEFERQDNIIRKIREEEISYSDGGPFSR